MGYRLLSPPEASIGVGCDIFACAWVALARACRKRRDARAACQCEREVCVWVDARACATRESVGERARARKTEERPTPSIEEVCGGRRLNRSLSLARSLVTPPHFSLLLSLRVSHARAHPAHASRRRAQALPWVARPHLLILTAADKNGG